MSSPAKNILIVSGLKVFPATTGGHIHTGHMATALARLGYNTRIFSLAGRQEHYVKGRPACLQETLEARAEEWTHLGLLNGIIQTTFRRLDYPHVWQAALMRRGWIPKALKESLNWADAILYNRPYAPPIPGPWSTKPRYLLSHNLEYRLLELGSLGERRYVNWMKEQEETAPARYHDIFACAEEDHDFFRQHDASGKLRLPYVRSCIDPHAYATPAGTRERLRAELDIADDERVVIFTGSNFGPNLDALARVKAYCRADEVWLRRNRIRLLLVGSMEPAPARDGVMIITGRVAEIAPYFAAADAGLNPVTIGSGANVKLFEYLGVRLPVISTRFGVRGTELQAGVDYIEYEPEYLHGALETYLQQDQKHWRTHAEAVWDRHRGTVDINEMVRAAVAQLPDFPRLNGASA